MFSEPPLLSKRGSRDSRSDHLLEPVFIAIKTLGGRLEGESQAEIIAQLRPFLCEELKQSSSRSLSSALWKLVVMQKRLVFAKEEVSPRDPMPCLRIYRVV